MHRPISTKARCAQIADATGGKFFRAVDSDTIEKAFKAIDQAQKIEFQAKSYLLTTELFAWFAVPGAVLLFLGALVALPPRTAAAERGLRPRSNRSGGRHAPARPPPTP